jgi:hypothetical protein
VRHFSVVSMAGRPQWLKHGARMLVTTAALIATVGAVALSSPVGSVAAMAPTAVTSSAALASPTVAAQPSRHSGLRTFWAQVGPARWGVTAGCYIDPKSDDMPAEARCDRYWTDNDGTVIQDSSAILRIVHGRAREVGDKVTDAVGAHEGKRVKRGSAIRYGGFKCLPRRSSFECRDLRSHHGFRIIGGSPQTYRIF